MIDAGGRVDDAILNHADVRADRRVCQNLAPASQLHVCRYKRRGMDGDDRLQMIILKEAVNLQASTAVCPSDRYQECLSTRA